jgi:hypothetical protein
MLRTILRKEYGDAKKPAGIARVAGTMGQIFMPSQRPNFDAAIGNSDP